MQKLRSIVPGLDPRKKSALMHGVVEGNIDAIVTFDHRGVIEAANRSAVKLFGYNSDDILGRPIGELVPSLDHLSTQENTGVTGLFEGVHESSARTMQGRTFPIDISSSTIDLGEKVLITAIIRDITLRKQQQHQLERQANHDDLTGLPNRAFLKERLKGCIDNRFDNTGCGGLLLIDLNQFKEINDTLGHDVGDDVLCEVGCRFSSTLPNHATVARFGGDEFAVIMERDGDARTALDIAAGLAKALEKPVNTSGISLNVGLSIGVALYPDHGNSTKVLLQRAEVALSVAKRTRRTCELYEPELDRSNLRGLKSATRLHSAIKSDQLFLHYQPKVCLDTGAVVSVEALSRWKDAELGQINPEDFIAVAEASGMIKPFTIWSLDKALEGHRAWRQSGHDFEIAVNLSARLLQDCELTDTIGECLDNAGIEAERLNLEITESAIMSDPERSLRTVESLHALGVQLSIDDFGTGYSSLAYLRDLPVQELKVDKSFVIDLECEAGDQLIVESTAKLAQGMGLKTTAEGVESPAAITMLRDYGYDCVQGFWIGKPMPAEALMSWLDDWNATRRKDFVSMESNPPVLKGRGK